MRVFDFDDPENNHFLAVRELWIKGPLYRRRADLIGFVNGIPLLFVELKNIHRNVRRAYDENLADYKDTIPHVFHHNAFVVLGNGVDARIGSYSAPFEYFREWKRLDEDEPGVVDMETLLMGVCTKANFLDLFENFVLFDDSGERLVKVVAQNQQYLGVTRAVRAVAETPERGRQARRLLAHAGGRQVLFHGVSSAARCTVSSAATSPSWCCATATTWTIRSTAPTPAAVSSASRRRYGPRTAGTSSGCSASTRPTSSP